MQAPNTDIYQFQSQLGQRLATWGGLSAGAAVAMALLGSRGGRRRFWQGVASQFAGWGLIDLAIALFGLRAAEKRAAAPESHGSQEQEQARETLRAILWANAGLDIGYVTGGLLLARSKGRDNPFWRGAGSAIVMQGSFLWVFDLIHALALTD